MQILYDAEADVLTFMLHDAPPFDSIEEDGGLIISYSKSHDPVSVEVLSALKRGLIDPSQTSLPLRIISENF
jgi:uncharacterized protein YuzE